MIVIKFEIYLSVKKINKNMALTQNLINCSLAHGTPFQKISVTIIENFWRYIVYTDRQTAMGEYITFVQLCWQR